MRIVVVGATGNVGTSVLQALGRDPAVESILGLARRRATARYAKTEFASADVTRDDLIPHFTGADCVIHLAWLIQPSRDRSVLWETNVEGSSRVFAAVAEAGVPALVVASSIGVYSPGPKRRVDESWPRDGIPTSWYSRQKAELERPRRAGRPPASGADHEAGERGGGAAALRRPLLPERAGPTGTAASLPAHPGSGRAAPPLARCRRGVSARRDA